MPPVWIPSFERTIENLHDLQGRSAERRVAEALNEIASPDVSILHSLRYSRPKHVGASVNLEIDFLVVWKNKGFLIMEVKGGRVEFDSTEGTWWCCPSGKPKKMYSRSPIQQVNSQKDDFCSDVLPQFISKQVNARLLVERVLVFPDVYLSDFKDQRGQRVHRIDDFEVDSIIDKDRMLSLASFVENKLNGCARYVQEKNMPGKIFEDIVRFLRPSVRAEIQTRHILEDVESQIETATAEQTIHLNHVLGTRCLLMDGPAGSAKTVLGLSAVLSWLDSGAEAYYITENKYLVDGLRRDKRYGRVQSRIMTIHDFLEKGLCVKIGFDETEMSKALAEWAFGSKGFSIVIDEAQDLDEDLYESLVSLLPSERLWVLLDSRQSLERKNDSRRYDVGLMSNATFYTLTKNCRNARPIAQYIKSYVRLPNDYVNDLLPEGDSPPQEILVDSTTMQDRKLHEIIDKCLKEGWTKSSLVVLSCLVGGRTAVLEKYCAPTSVANYRELFSYGGEDPNKVAIYYSLDFRGLEAPVVIVSDIHDQESIYRAHYISGSRAKCKLVLIRVEDAVAIRARESEIPDGLSFG